MADSLESGPAELRETLGSRLADFDIANYLQLLTHNARPNRRLHDVAQELTQGTIPAEAFGALSRRGGTGT